MTVVIALRVVTVLSVMTVSTELTMLTMLSVLTDLTVLTVSIVSAVCNFTHTLLSCTHCALHTHSVQFVWIFLCCGDLRTFV